MLFFAMREAKILYKSFYQITYSLYSQIWIITQDVYLYQLNINIP